MQDSADLNVIPFSKISNHDIAVVGGKNASLGEMFNQLAALGIKVPDGFATTADAMFWNMRALSTSTQ